MKIVQDAFFSLIVTVLVLPAFLLLSYADAQVRTSNNYQLQSDSINVGGGLSDSTSYGLESTVGEIATGRSTSSNFSLQAGYQQMQEVYISLSSIADIVMDTDLPGLTGGTSNGSTTFTVITDSPAGYQVTIEAENDPAMQRADAASIDNYNDGASADFAFTIPTASAVFGFSPEGVDVSAAFLDSGSGPCGVGSTDTVDACWAGVSTTATTIAEASDANHPDGATTTIEFQVGIANGANIESGLYVATTTVTALPL